MSFSVQSQHLTLFSRNFPSHSCSNNYSIVYCFHLSLSVHCLYRTWGCCSAMNLKSCSVLTSLSLCRSCPYMFCSHSQVSTKYWDGMCTPPTLSSPSPTVFHTPFFHIPTLLNIEITIFLFMRISATSAFGLFLAAILKELQFSYG